MWRVHEFLLASCKRRAGFYVDGFNLYHALASLKMNHLKWLDLRALAELRIDRRREKLVRVVYCTAYPTHIQDRGKLARHKTYVAALEARGVDCQIGNFKLRPKTRCRHCGHEWQTHEEKESDVMLALQILHDAHLDRVDHVYLVSGDSDFGALARLFRQHFPQKKLISVAPPRRGHSKEVLHHAHGKRKITLGMLERSLLPAQLIAGDGREIRRPAEYDPPAP